MTEPTNPYAALTDAHDRWTHATGFTDPLDGVESAVPPGVDRDVLAACCLALGDDALVYSHRLQQWITHLPELEIETAVANIALDLLGQARLLLTRAGQADGTGRGEDELALRRDAAAFRNVRLVEPPDADFAELVGRLLVFASWRLAWCERLAGCPDPVLAAITGKAVHELAYHRDYAAAWVIRLGDGTPLSRGRMRAALHRVWPLVDELFTPGHAESALADLAAGDQPWPGGRGGAAVALRGGVDAVVDAVLATAGLDRPAFEPALPPPGGRDGVHTRHLDDVLAELQSVARAYPGAIW